MFGWELRTPVELFFGPPPEPEIPGGPGVRVFAKAAEQTPCSA